MRTVQGGKKCERFKADRRELSGRCSYAEGAGLQFLGRVAVLSGAQRAPPLLADEEDNAGTTEGDAAGHGGWQEVFPDCF